MSNNPSGQPGSGDSSEQSWPEYLSSRESRGSVTPGEASTESEGHPVPRRVIGNTELASMPG